MPAKFNEVTSRNIIGAKPQLTLGKEFKRVLRDTTFVRNSS